MVVTGDRWFRQLDDGIGAHDVALEKHPEGALPRTCGGASRSRPAPLCGGGRGVPPLREAPVGGCTAHMRYRHDAAASRHRFPHLPHSASRESAVDFRLGVMLPSSTCRPQPTRRPNNLRKNALTPPPLTRLRWHEPVLAHVGSRRRTVLGARRPRQVQDRKVFGCE